MRRLRVFALALGLGLVASPAMATTATQVVQRATDAVGDFLDHVPPDDVTRIYAQNAYGVLVMPDLVKGGFVLGAEHGFGVLLVRDPESGAFGPPAFFEAFGGSIGLQAGGKSSDVLVTIMNPEAVDAMLDGDIQLGGQFSLAVLRAGGAFGAATTTALGEDLYVFERPSGFFGGASLSGARIRPQEVHHDDYWGATIDPEEVVREFDRRDPRSAELRELLGEF
ncbi:MAG: lipid-binding SYLF domain-containing protein [Alphaproteobacteria bacterium]